LSVTVFGDLYSMQATAVIICTASNECM